LIELLLYTCRCIDGALPQVQHTRRTFHLCCYTRRSQLSVSNAGSVKKSLINCKDQKATVKLH